MSSQLLVRLLSYIVSLTIICTSKASYSTSQQRVVVSKLSQLHDSCMTAAEINTAVVAVLFSSIEEKPFGSL